MTRYAVVFEREDDGGYSVWGLDLPGCASQGDSYDEAMANIRDAIESYLEAHAKLGRPVPEARTEVQIVEVPAA
jgi:predicted RNase H-like HicB family nuclease